MNRLISAVKNTAIHSRKSPLIALGFLLLAACSAQAANILIVAGTDPTAQQAATVLNADLGGSNTVTVVNTGVPASLTGFTQIYDVRYINTPGFTAGEMTQYLAFLNAAPNNTLFLMGENTNPVFAARDSAINQFITLAGGGTVTMGPFPSGTSSALETLAAPFTTTPNAITTVEFAGCGLATTTGTGAFASQEAGGGCSLYFTPGTLANATGGALVVVYDVNFIATAPTGGPALNETAFRQNLEQFVSTPSGGAPPPPPAPTATGVPTLSEWTMIFLGCALAFLAARKLTPGDSGNGPASA